MVDYDHANAASSADFQAYTLKVRASIAVSGIALWRVVAL
jgi:hypothetical protein